MSHCCDEIRVARSEDTRNALTKHALSSQSGQRLRAMMSCAEAVAGVAIRSSDLERDPWAFNVANGMIDLRTGKLRRHRRRDMITGLAPIAFDRVAQCPRFKSFVLEIMGDDQDMATFLQRAVGYSLTGVATEQVLLLLHGSGSNGKSVLLEVMHALCGDYAGRANFTTFIEQRADRRRNDIARLAGLRLVTALEIGEGARLSEAVIKQVTGGDTIAARRPRSRARFRSRQRVAGPQIRCQLGSWRATESVHQFSPSFRARLATRHRVQAVPLLASLSAHVVQHRC